MWNENLVIALVFTLSTIALMWTILLKGLGGDNAVFAILGYSAGWMSSIILFYFRKRPAIK